MLWRNDGLMDKYCQIFKYYMFYITERIKHTRPDAVADRHKQNVNLLFCDNYRSDKSLAVSNANNKGWTDFSRLTIILLIYEFPKWKFYQIKWLWLFGFYYWRQEKSKRLISSKSCAASLLKKKSPHCCANLRGTLNYYEHLIKVLLHYVCV